MSIHKLIENKDVEGIRALLDTRVDVDARDDNHYTPLMHASHLGREAVARLLLDWGAEVDARDEDQETPLHYAALKGHEAVVRLLLDRGADVNARDWVQRTPLHKAVFYGRVDAVHLLLDRGAEMDARDEDQWTPLHYTGMLFGGQNVVKLLLNRGADPFFSNCFLLEETRRKRLSRANALFPIATECTLPPEIMLAIWATSLHITEKRWLALM